MNILLASTNSSLRNGASRCLLNIVDCLPEHHFVVLFPDFGELCQELEKRNIPCYIVRQHNWVWYRNRGEKTNAIRWIKYWIRKYFHNAVAVGKVKKIIRQERIDLVHMNALTGYVPAVAARKLGVPYVWHIRELVKDGANLEFSNNTYCYNLIGDAARVICVSKWIRNSYLEELDEVRLRLIYDGVDRQKFESDHPILQEDSELLKLTISGRITPSKGQLDLVQAVEIVKKKTACKILCRCVGDFEDQDYVARIRKYVADHELGDNVELIPFVKNPQTLLWDSDVVCVCSETEAFGLSTVEAMLAGCLVIGANTGCTGELITHRKTGLLYQYGNPQDLADNILYALKYRQEARGWAIRGKKEACENYTLEIMVDKLKQLYKEFGERK